MVRHAVDRQQRAAQIAQDAPDERIETLLHFWSGEISAVFGAENGVVEVLCECAGHGSPNRGHSPALRAEETFTNCLPGTEVPGYGQAPSGRHTCPPGAPARKGRVLPGTSVPG